MRRFKQWSVFQCLATMMLRGRVTMQEEALAHIPPASAYHNALLTTEELRTVALLKRIQIKFAALEFFKKKKGRLDVNGNGSSRSRKPSRKSLSVEVGDLIQNRYKIMARLGEGYYGKVFKCKDLQKGTILSIKIMKDSADQQYKVNREIRMLSMLTSLVPKDQNLFVEMYDWFDYQGHKCIIFELLGKSVFDFLKDNNNSSFPIEHVRQIAHQLCTSVAFMHAKGFSHNDLKTKNIVFHDDEYYNNYLIQDKSKEVGILKNPEIRLIDFGSTSFAERRTMRPNGQHMPYKAPEVVIGFGGSQFADVWSVGCIIFEIATGFKMFDTHSSHEHLAMMQRILGQIPSTLVKKSKLKYFSNGKLKWDEESERQVMRKVKPLLEYIPMEKRGNEDWEELFQMISQMLRYEPSKRITLAECLENPFLKKFKQHEPIHF